MTVETSSSRRSVPKEKNNTFIVNSHKNQRGRQDDKDYMARVQIKVCTMFASNIKDGKKGLLKAQYFTKSVNSPQLNRCTRPLRSSNLKVNEFT